MDAGHKLEHLLKLLREEGNVHASKMDEVRELFPGVVRDVLVSETTDHDTKKLVLTMVVLTCETWPRIFEDGMFGPTLFELLPVLAMPSREHLHNELIVAIEKLALLMLVQASEVSTARLLLQDLLDVFFNTCSSPSLPDTVCFTSFSKELSDRTKRVYECKIDLSTSENCRLMHGAAGKLSSLMIRTSPHFFADNFLSLSLWQRLCDQVQIGSDAALNLLASVTAGTRVPEVHSELLATTMIKSIRFRARNSGAGDNSLSAEEDLAMCLESAYLYLPAEVLRLESAEMLDSLVSCLRQEKCSVRLKRAACRCLLPTFEHCPAIICGVSQFAEFCKCADLQSELVIAIQAALRLCRTSSAHKSAALEAFELSRSTPMECDSSACSSRKRLRAQLVSDGKLPKRQAIVKSNDAMEVEVSGQEEHGASEPAAQLAQDFVCATLALFVTHMTKAKDVINSGREKKGTSAGELITAITILQTTLMCIEEETEACIWTPPVEHLAELLDDKNAKFVSGEGTLCLIFTIIHRMCTKLPGGVSVALVSRILFRACSCASFNMSAMSSAEQESCTCRMIEALSVAPAACLWEDADSIITKAFTHSSPRVRVCTLQALPFCIRRSTEMLKAADSWVAILCKLLAGKERNEAPEDVVQHVPAALEDIICIMCGRECREVPLPPHQACIHPGAGGSSERRKMVCKHVILRPLECGVKESEACEEEGMSRPHAGASKHSAATRVPADVCKQVLRALSSLVSKDSGKGSHIIISALRALPPVLAHVPEDALQLHKDLLKSTMYYVTAEDSSMELRQAACELLASTVRGDGSALTAWQGTKTFDEALHILMKDLKAVFESSDPSESGGDIQGVLLAMGLLGQEIVCTSLSRKYLGSIVGTLAQAGAMFYARYRYALANSASASLDIIAKSRGCEMCDLVHEHLTSIYWGLLLMVRSGGGESSANSAKSQYDERLLPAFGKLFFGFYVPDLAVANKQMLMDALPCVLPLIIESLDEELLELIAERIGERPGVLVVEHFSKIAMHLFLLGDERAKLFERMKEMITRITEEDLDSLVNEWWPNILSDIITTVCEYELPDDVERGRLVVRKLVAFLGGKKESVTADMRIPTLELMQDNALKDFYPKMLYKLTNDNFRSSDLAAKLPSEVLRAQKNVLRVLDMTIPMLGKHLNEYFAIIFNSVKCAQTVPALHELVCHVWETLITNLGPGSLQLQTSLTQIVVNLLSLAKPHSQRVATSLHFLLVQHKDRLIKHIEKIPFPLDEQIDAPCLEAPMKVLRGLQQVHSLHEVVMRGLHGLRCADEMVQNYALKELRMTLKLQKDVVAEVFRAGLASDVADMTDLVLVLMQMCGMSKAHKLRMLASECLGQIGAIDPARMGPLMRQDHSIGEKTDDDLAIELIVEHLVKMVKSSTMVHSKTAQANSQSLVERAQIAIKELLKLLGCVGGLEESPTKTVSRGGGMRDIRDCLTQGGHVPLSQHARALSTGGGVRANVADPRGQENWEKIPKDVQQVVRPLLSLDLVYEDKLGNPTYPIYARGMKLYQWVGAFARDLVARVQGTRRQLFDVLKPILRHNAAIALFVLPHVVFNVVCHGSDADRETVRGELLKVLEDARVLEDEVDSGVVLSLSSSSIDGSTLIIESTQHKPPPCTDYLESCIRVGAEKRRIISAIIESRGRLNLTLDLPFTEMPGDKPYSVIRGISALGSSEEDAQEGATSVTQTVFDLVDQLTRWHERESLTLRRGDAGGGGGRAGVQDRKVVENVEGLLNGIPKRILAETSFRCQAYDRALLYLETSLREEWNKKFDRGEFLSLPPPMDKRCDQPTLELLQRIYAGLDDADGLKSVAKLRDKTSLEEQILDCEIAGDWTGALACYEQLLQEAPGVMRNHFQLLRCLRNLSHLQTTLTHAEGCLVRYPREASRFSAFGAEAAWRLGRWDLLKEYLEKADESSGRKQPFECYIGQILLAMKAGDVTTARKASQKARMTVLEPLAAASMESYHRAYKLLVRLQQLWELEQVEGVLFDEHGARVPVEKARIQAQRIATEWEDRFELTQAGLLGREPLLAVRRVLFEMLGMTDEVACSWMHSVRAARRAGHERTAYTAILQAERYHAAEAHLERAKLKWSQPTDRHEALRVLRQYIDSAHVRGGAARDASSERILVKTLVLHWKWVQEIGLHQTSEVRQKFEEELKHSGCAPSERAHFLLGQLYDMQVFPERSASRYGGEGKGGTSTVAKGGESAQLISEVLRNYAESLRFGHKHIFQSLPRLLTLWFENSGRSQGIEQAKVNDTMRGMVRNMPTYVWLTVFPQLVSRICHKDPNVLNTLKEILAKVIAKHPRQALWAMVAVLKSSQAERNKPANEIKEKALKEVEAIKDLKERKERLDCIEDLLGRGNQGGFIEELIKCCNLGSQKGKNSKVKTMSMSVELRSMQRMAPLKNVIVPLQSLLTPTLPSSGRPDQRHNPFPAQPITIKAFGDQIDLMASLMCPVVIRIQGSDGTEYKFLCKPKDDLRKDSRMMDLNTMINRLLVKDTDSRRRNLHIRTFSVIPLNENNGLVQWVNDTSVLRTILNDLYSRNLGPESIKTSKIQDLFAAKLRPRGDMNLIEAYEKVLCVKFRPIFHRWFLEHFSTPADWVAACNTYIRTTAVWSMVGYVVGLGDRHAENVLFDATNGDCVHVDFACLFNKGESLTVPERVPFRLTPNIVDPMGVSGYDGGFTNICVCAMKVLRGNHDSLLNVLETFLHDPLIEWLKKTAEEGQRALSKCERRLQGGVTKFPNTRDITQLLSVDGQVRAVIAEAADTSNLAQMYRWWMPWY